MTRHRPLERGPSWTAILTAVLVAALASGCGDDGATATDPEVAVERTAAPDQLGLEPLPTPDLDDVDPRVKGRAAELEGEVRRLLSEGRVDRRALGEAFGELGQFYMAYHLVDAASSCLANAAVADPDALRWSYLAGFLHQIQGRMEPAGAAYAAVLEQNPQHLEARLRLAEVHLELGRPDAAGPLLDAILGESPDHPVAQYHLGRVALAQDDAERAAGLLESVVAAQPQAGAARYALAQAYRKLGRLDDARGQLEGADERPPSFDDPWLQNLSTLGVTGEFYRLRAERALAAGAFGVAASNYERLLATGDGGYRDRKRFATVLYRLGESERALAELQAALTEGDADDAPEEDLQHTRSLLARAGSAPGPEGAVDGATVGAPPAAVVNLVQNANGARRRGDAATAENLYRQALAQAPGQAEVRLNLADLLLERGRYGEAAAQYAQISAAQADNFEAWHGEATSLLLQGRHADARRRLETAIAALPERGALIHLLARTLAIAPEAEVRDPETAFHLAIGIFQARESSRHAETVAMAMAASGRFEDAVRWQRDLVEGADGDTPPVLLARWRAQLESYEAQSPWVATTPERFFGPAG